MRLRSAEPNHNLEMPLPCLKRNVHDEFPSASLIDWLDFDARQTLNQRVMVQSNVHKPGCSLGSMDEADSTSAKPRKAEEW